MLKTKKQKTNVLRLIRTNGMVGFTLTNIQEVLSPRQFARFQSWNFGQTVGVYKHEPFIYKHDFERFKAGLPPLD